MDAGTIALLLGLVQLIGLIAVAVLKWRPTGDAKVAADVTKDGAVDKQEAEIRAEQRADIAALKVESKEKDIRVRELEKLNRNLEIQNEELTRRNELLEKEVAALKLEREVLKATMGNMETRMNKLQDELFDLRRRG